MTARQHTPLVLIVEGSPSRYLLPVLGKTGSGYDEAWVRDLVFAHPETIPVQEVDPSFGPLVPICTELDTRAAGYADALFLNHLGMPTLVECKLWRNPEARREVVGQILDYARVLRRWTYTDLQREAARARKEQGFDLADHVRRQGHPDLEHAAFVDNVTRNLARGRVLLLILGDGIREGVEEIVEYLQCARGLHFTFGLVEAQVFELGEGRRIVQPRVLARTLIVNRTIVDLAKPELVVVEEDAEDDGSQAEPTASERWMLAFWTELLSSLMLDDADQPLAKPTAQSTISFSLPPRGHLWLTCFFSVKRGAIGVYLAGWGKASPFAAEIGNRLEADREAIDAEIGIPITWLRNGGKLRIEAAMRYPDLRDPTVRQEQLAWFRTPINAFVNALRPRVAKLWRQVTDSDRQVVA